MKVTLNRREYLALDALRGLPEDAHMLIMCCTPTETGGILEGSQRAFEELVDFVSEEFSEGMLPASKVRALTSLCVKIDPECADWLGM
ncbi:MAG: hypothetical protein EA397_17905 [Deltaproteobacteria bacterium]|nr:MAG: hypothetical protein EA397_17905 [Deltaproteobacteria bacterium]